MEYEMCVILERNVEYEMNVNIECGMCVIKNTNRIWNRGYELNMAYGI